ncbi:hypothetical protein RR46_07037 [Papilio xuthus]|uniref:Uncharacterized protein n=1 Tax=Papilio xuthus TaxID=66420 RepID=A0A194Q4H6_PAPXU|nr:hypothetical protein RR46_07037 [Papilio xuthus]
MVKENIVLLHISERVKDMCEVNPHLASVVDYDLVTSNLGYLKEELNLYSRRQKREAMMLEEVMPTMRSLSPDPEDVAAVNKKYIQFKTIGTISAVMAKIKKEQNTTSYNQPIYRSDTKKIAE